MLQHQLSSRGLVRCSYCCRADKLLGSSSSHSLLVLLALLVSPHHSPVATASFSFSFQCFATFSESGSSGLGALRSA